MMIHAKNGEKFFNRKFIKKLKYYYNNDEVQSMIRNVNPKDLVDCYGKTLLHYAVEAGNEELVEHLIGRGFEVDAPDAQMDTPLALAIKRTSVRMMNVLLTAKADLFFQGHELVKLGLRSHSLGHTSVAMIFVEALKKKYPNDIKKIANILLEIQDPFPRAMLFKNTTLTRYMLSKGCSVHDSDSERDTALHYAVECMSLENVKLLLQLGADVDARDWNRDTPLHRYKFGGEENYEILHCLLNHGASLDDINDDGFTVVSETFKNEKMEHVKVLLDHGVDLCDEHTLIHDLAQNENPGVMELLENQTFDVDARNNEGRTALYIAAEYANDNAVEFLLKKGADPNIFDENQETVLYYSLDMRGMMYWPNEKSANYSKCVELLLEYGADVQFVSSKQETLFDKTSDIAFLRPAIAQVAMMKVMDQRVDDRILAKIQSHEVFVKYFSVCQEKMEEIKSTVIRDKVTLATFLVEPEGKLLMYARNQENRAGLEWFLRREDRSEFYFVKILWKRVKNIVEFVKLREQAGLSICEISGCYNREVIDRLVVFLDKQAMENVCKV